MADRLIELYVFVDDSSKEIDELANKYGYQLPSYEGKMSMSEVLTILIFYHDSQYKCFKYYYTDMVQMRLKSYFPNTVSYKRLLTIISRCIPHLCILAKKRCAQSEATQRYFIDSKKLPVCHNRRIHSHKVFDCLASRGKSSTGWFFGFKIHLIINNLGEIMNFCFTPANVADNNHELLRKLTAKLKGRCFADKGYISKIFEELYERGFILLAKFRSNMKNALVRLDDKYGLAKRGLIESVNELLMTGCNIEHTRHRSPDNAFSHMLSALVAYSFRTEKPSIKFHYTATQMPIPSDVFASRIA